MGFKFKNAGITLVAAACPSAWGIAGETGTLQVGEYADSVALQRNPLDEIYATKEPVFVMKQGVVYLGEQPK